MNELLSFIMTHGSSVTFNYEATRRELEHLFAKITLFHLKNHLETPACVAQW